MIWNILLNLRRHIMKNDIFFCTHLHPIRTQPKKKGLVKMTKPLSVMAGTTGLEPATSGVTGRRSNQN